MAWQTSQEEQIDGVDFDWEAPRNSKDLQGYELLLRESYEELYLKHDILLSVALHPQQKYRVLARWVQRVNIMAYDMSSAQSNHHAPQEALHDAITEFLGAGFPPNKLVLGMPAYGRNARNPNQVQTYAEIVDAILQADPAADHKTITRNDQWKGFFFDSPRLVKRKVDYAIKHSLAGVFFWELGQDKQHEEFAPGGLLLEAAARQVQSSNSMHGSNVEL